MKSSSSDMVWRKVWLYGVERCPAVSCRWEAVAMLEVRW
jgi:hypothetical protein